MNPISRMALALLLAALCAAQTQAQPASNAPRSRVAQFSAAEAALQASLKSPEAALIFRHYNAAHSQQIQHHLQTIYGADKDYQRDAAGSGRPLDDSIVGPVTLGWLARFCRDYGIVASNPGKRGFAHAVVTALEQVAALTRAHPDWRQIVFSPDFEDWINEQPTPQAVESLKLRRSGAASQVNALIDQYLKAGRKGARAKPPTSASARRAAPDGVTYGYDPARPLAVRDLKLIAARLAPLAGRPPEDEQGFFAEVERSLDGIELDPDTRALVRRYSQVDAYMIGPELLDHLANEGMSAPAVSDLRAQLGSIEYLGTEAIETAYTGLVEASFEREELERERRRIMRAARLTRYTVPATLAADLSADAALAEPIKALFAPIAKVEYPTAELLEKALEHQVKRGMNMCSKNRVIPNGWLAEDSFKALAEVLSEHRPLFDEIGTLRGVATQCDASQLVRADALAYEAYRVITPRLHRKMALQITHRMPPGAEPAGGWAVPGCRCGRPARDGLVYGFYPLWTDAGERQIDFGAMSRIGLYGLTVGEDGALRGPPGMRGAELPPHLAGMMRAAHRYNVKVDWVLSRSSWRAGDPEGTANSLRMLAANVMELVQRPLPGGEQTAIKFGSLGLDRGATGGDGVALYFRYMPAEYAPQFNEFVAALAGQLAGLRPARRLSIVVDRADLGRPGAFDYNNLRMLLDKINRIPDDMPFSESRGKMLRDMPIMVMLPESTQESKKALRASVQETLRGADSVRLLRTILPVFEYDGVDPQQLADDIVYVSDNYFGIGFWPLAWGEAGYEAESKAESKAGSESGAGGIDAKLARYYQPSGDPTGFLLRGSLCAQRLWLRWAGLITFALAAVVVGIYVRCRGCNERIDNSGLYFLGMVLLVLTPLAILGILAYSDPLAERHRLVLLGLVTAFLVALVAGSFWFHRRERRRKLP